ncbi:hypothetical protein Poli38472_008469 [Pythium oligandrum]|uniref:Chloride channel protein n=1 Tax=Pythium oligandrum TaxID=41045 RepID=A0A8K1C3H4_PYTOL|nr:hypothetical protein Poli38472_008469 [Pythium oligandrum]|eukprot:TMW55821.1 hypothetical protein Poli38472_008469 [Pythium oligandrum]
MQSPGNLQDELLPSHMRRAGRMESLHEFQRRAMSYDEGENKQSPIDHQIALDIGRNYRLDQLLDPEGKKSPQDQHMSLNAIFGDQLIDPDSGKKSPQDQHMPLNAIFGRAKSQSLAVSELSEDLRHAVRTRRASSSLFGGVKRSKRTTEKYYRRQAKVLCFLVLLGVIGGPFNYCIRLLFGQIKSLRIYLVGLCSSDGSQFVVWTAHTVFFTMLGVLWTRLSPVAAGSGVSQMKSIMTGIDPRMYLPGYFDASTFIAKVFGLSCAVGAGLIVGTEGAYVHIMSIITHHLLHTPMFAGFCGHLNGRLQLLAAACAVGVASTFSSPIGGVLFSMEVTSTYYLISNYMKAFISSVSGSLMLQITLALADSSSKELESTAIKTSLGPVPFVMWEIPLYVILGCLIGVLAWGMVVLLRVVAQKRKKLRTSKSKWKRRFATWVDPLAVAILTATVTYWPGEFARLKSLEELAILFTQEQLPESWQIVSKFYSLAILSITYIILLPLSISLQIPTGIWLPTFIAGAAFGRMFGEALRSIHGLEEITPGAFALAGAAAFAGASTRTVSAAVITLEITGSMPLMLPIFCTVLAAIGVFNMCPEQSVYDTLLLISGMPYLPLVDFDPKLVASDIVEPLLVYVTKRTTVGRLLLTVMRMKDQDLPVVHNEVDMRLLGLVDVNQVKDLIRHYYEANNLPDVEVDLGEAPTSTPNDFSWTTLMSKVSRTKNAPGGFYGQMSYDYMYQALATTIKDRQPNQIGPNGAVPFMMDDDRMMQLISESWSEDKKRLLEKPIKLTYGGHCALKPMALTVSSFTPLDDLHMIFTMMRCDHCYVCDQGSLAGVVTTKTMLQISALEQHDK